MFGKIKNFMKRFFPSSRKQVNDRFDVLENKIKSIHLNYLKIMPRVQISFSVGLVEHCNLRFAYCDHFSPIAESEFLNIDEFQKDFKRLSELFPSNGENAWGGVRQISLMGGEPLLHPELHLFLETARKYFPSSVIKITTNGLLLSKMNEEFWNSCRENHIIINPTKYPINLDYDTLEKLAHEKKVDYQYYNEKDVVKTLMKCPLNKNGLQDERNSFLHCYRANGCLYLQHGRFYTCTVAPTAHHLNKRFGTNFMESPKDFVDIYAVNCAQEIMEFLAKPIPFCRYCMPEKLVTTRWKKSELDMSEWVE